MLNWKAKKKQKLTRGKRKERKAASRHARRIGKAMVKLNDLQNTISQEAAVKAAAKVIEHACCSLQRVNSMVA